MIDYDAEYKAAMAEFRREERQLDMFFRGLILLGCMSIVAVIAIGIAYS